MKKNEKIIAKPNSSNDFEKEYNNIMKDSFISTSTQKQWVKEGDFFVRLSLYNNLSPVKTSGSTSLLTK